MFRIMASEDCGISYQAVLETDDMKIAAKKLEELDNQGLRWFIEDGTTILDIHCKIHRQLVQAIKEIQEERL